MRMNKGEETMYAATRTRTYSPVHFLVYQHIRYTRQPNGKYTQEIKQDSMTCYNDEHLDDVIPGLSYCPTLDVYAVKDHQPGCFEFYMVVLDSTAR